MDARATIALLPEAARATTAAIDRIGGDAWSNDSPCEDWSVRDLVNHLTSEHLWAPHLLRGETLEDVGDRYDGDVVAEDPQGAWRQAVARSMMAFGSADPDGTVHTTMGEIPTGLYATQMLTDLTVHGWDVSQGARTAYEPVPDAIEAVWAYSRPRRESNGESAIFDRPVPTDSPDRLDQLVALLGRDPRWGVAHPV